MGGVKVLHIQGVCEYFQISLSNILGKLMFDAENTFGASKHPKKFPLGLNMSAYVLIYPHISLYITMCPNTSACVHIFCFTHHTGCLPHFWGVKTTS